LKEGFYLFEKGPGGESGPPGGKRKTNPLEVLVIEHGKI
jgi:hypothetical protein